MVFHRATVIIRLVVVTSVVKGTQLTWHSVSILSRIDSRLTTTSCPPSCLGGIWEGMN